MKELTAESEYFVTDHLFCYNNRVLFTSQLLLKILFEYNDNI